MSIADIVRKQLEQAESGKPVEKANTEVAANAEDFAWYVYSSSVGLKLNGDPELTLTEGSSFGMRPTSEESDTVDLVSEEAGMNTIYRITAEIAATIMDRSVEAESDAEDEDETTE